MVMHEQSNKPDNTIRHPMCKRKTERMVLVEPWQEEEMRLLRQERLPRPRCVCCGEPLSPEFLDLTAFGIRGFGCQRCVEGNTKWTPEE